MPTWILLLSFFLLPAAEPPLVETPPVPVGDADGVKRLLAAGDPASVAWAAYHAARLRLAIAVPDLLAYIADHPDPAASEPERTARSACAAALADLRQSVAEGVPARLLATGSPGAAYYLAALDPARHEGWLIDRVQAEAHDDAAWLLAANLLAKRRTPAATLALHGGLAPTLTIEVWDAGRGGGGRKRAVSCSDGVSQRRPGFPPLVVWGLTVRAEQGVELLADGPTPIWASRREQTLASEGCGSVRSHVARGPYRVRLLESLLGCTREDHPNPTLLVSLHLLNPEGVQMPLEHDRTTSLAWQDSDTLRRQIDATVAEQQTRWTALTASLIGTGLLPAGTPPPTVRLLLVDKRSGETLEPLPDPATVLPSQF